MIMTRRKFAKTVSIGAAMAQVATSPLRAQSRMQVKALVFDTFGTVVDWRGSIIAEGQAWSAARSGTKGSPIDWARFADRWRDGYAPAMERVRKGELPWTKLDDLHRMLLNDLLKEFGMSGLSEAEIDHWNKVWHRLKPWPDAVAGLTRLKKKYIIAPLSNGNVSLLTEMAKNSGLPWDLILSAELAKHYKPDREAYLTAVNLLGLKPGEVMMAAAHSGDLRAAASSGLRTGFIHRPNERGAGGKADQAKVGEFDVVSNDIGDLATKLGA
jgi:2-haloacid dehalogenase